MSKKKLEFSQKVVVASWALSALWITLYFILAFFGLEISGDVTSTIVTEAFVVSIGYMGYQGVLKCSRNRHELDENALPLKWREKLLEQHDTLFDEEEKDEDEILEDENPEEIINEAEEV